MRKRVYIFVNGIDTFPWDKKNWNGRAVTWTTLRWGHWGKDLDYVAAEMLEYFCGPIGAAFHQKARGAKLAEKIEAYQAQGFEIVLVGHSNGTKVVLAAIGLLEDPKIAEVHLLSAACDRNFDTNGLNDWLKHREVERVFIYDGGKDGMLRLAASWLGRLLGYGTMGLKGPCNVKFTDRVLTTIWPGFGHSDCWSPQNFDETLRLITAGAGGLQASAPL